MIIGIGTDIVEIARIESLFDKRQQSFAKRILSISELKGFASKQYPQKFLAKRWAAKEAIAKALGTGFSKGVCFTDMTIEHTKDGQPMIKLSGKTKVLADSKHIKNWSISISDEKHYAIAFAIAET